MKTLVKSTLRLLWHLDAGVLLSPIHTLLKLLIACYSSFFLQNELAILEFIHNLVETLDRYFSNVVSLGKKCNLLFFFFS